MRIAMSGVERRLLATQDLLEASVSRVTRSGRLLLGMETERLEKALAETLGHREVVCVASGTDALRLTLQTLQLEPDDEVIVPAFTAVPTAAAVCAAGGRPVFADVEAGTGTIDPSAVAAVRSQRTKAIVAVHLYGRRAAVEALRTLGLPIVEDAAQAQRAVSEHCPNLVAYSFYPTKNLGGIGDGGAIGVPDGRSAEELRLLRHHGMHSLYVHDRIATNSRMSELEAAYLAACLPKLEAWTERRRWIAARYREAAPNLAWQEPAASHVYHLCVARVKSREQFQASLARGDWSQGISIESAVHYPRALTQQPAYRRFARTPCPVAEQWANRCLSFPCYPELTDEEVSIVATALGRGSEHESGARAW